MSWPEKRDLYPRAKLPMPTQQSIKDQIQRLERERKEKADASAEGWHVFDTTLEAREYFDSVDARLVKLRQSLKDQSTKEQLVRTKCGYSKSRTMAHLRYLIGEVEATGREGEELEEEVSKALDAAQRHGRKLERARLTSK